MYDYDDVYVFKVPRDEKTKWKEDIRRALLRPDYAISPEDFCRKVKQAVDVVALEYPNWNAYKEISEGISEIENKWINKFEEWIKKNEPMKWYKRYNTEKQFKFKNHHEILIFLRNYCARYGMLTEGPRDSRAIPYGKENEP